ncbi:DUF2946 family protein [Piscinibacter sp. XHJ-5]|uniref:DUF2946 family protein n=1 Tax=Piscinibacter sp. XHJ-5 TaxID=3037797 RepID=UPI0024530E8F|nr:DUF2946 family protein [Piscinibacter sp. XHJ-5]
MSRASWLTRWTVRLAVVALLLKAAVPMLASMAAQLQGASVAQVCDVYGVALPSHHDHAHHGEHAGHHGEHHPGSDAAHKSDHCALTALAALAPQAMAPLSLPLAPPPLSDVQAHAPFAVADAAAAWIARLHHGPPASS